jgi:hypothetical protein
MIDIRLEDLELYKALCKRDERVARVLQGALIVIAGDARELLQFARNRFPSFTSHDLQHSWRIVSRIESILTPEAKADLSSIEIFAFVTAAALHDVGMISTTGTANEVRQTHHLLSEAFILSYMSDRLSLISEYLPRLSEAIGFIARSHGTTWEAMAASDLFNRPEKIAGLQLRAGILAILLRIGDLLDLDCDRSCDALRRHGATYFEDATSQLHHERHKHVRHFNYDFKEIAVAAEAFSKEEHSIWDEWFSYLRQDILHANTYLFRDSLNKYRLPIPFLEVRKAPSATYDLWPIRFELDEKGRIWDIISQSIYVGRLDFLRELIQNAIDANLMWMYVDDNASVSSEIPRLWEMKDYFPIVLVIFGGNASTDGNASTLEIFDDGIGMDKEALQKYLFRVAETGFGLGRPTRGKRFPSIAKFGIGFVSCLVRANKIVINTRPRQKQNGASLGRRVILKPQSLDAYSEDQACRGGTRVWLELKDRIRDTEIASYVQSTFVYPSVPVGFINVIAVQELIRMAADLDIQHNVKLPLSIPESSLWEFTTETIDAIQALFSSLEKVSTDRKLPLPRTAMLDTASLTRPHDILDKFPTDPFLVFLDAQFDVVDISYPAVTGRGTSTASVMWIPVRLLLPDRGIDWVSIHGFLIHKNSLTPSMTSYSQFAQEFENEGFARITTEEFLEDELDDIGENVVDLVDIMNRRMRRKDKTVLAADDTPDTEDEMVKIVVQSDAIIVNRGYEEGEPLFFGGEDYTDSPLSGESSLSRLIDFLDNQVYQDGIPIPVEGFWITPIGACRARCNLTGTARMDLNVSRNAINESPALLSVWAEEVARPIQEGVLTRVLSALGVMGYHVDPAMLVTAPEYKSPLLQQSSGILRSLIASISSALPKRKDSPEDSNRPLSQGGK